jgi:hypothetical protein
MVLNGKPIKSSFASSTHRAELKKSRFTDFCFKKKVTETINYVLITNLLSPSLLSVAKKLKAYMDLAKMIQS